MCLVGFNIKFVLSLCSGTKNTPLCNLKKIKTAQVLKNYLNGVLEDAYLVWFGFGSGFVLFF